MSKTSQNRYLVIAGPTGSGKTGLALKVAKEIPSEIIGCDSIQIFKGFDIGSAKPTAEELSAAPHHLIDYVNWDEEYDAARYAEEAKQKIEEVISRGKLPIIVGGAGLYLRAMWDDNWHGTLPKDEVLRESLNKEDKFDLYEKLKKVDPARAAVLHPNDKFRVVRSLELNQLLGKPLSEVPTGSSSGQNECFLIVLDPPRSALLMAIENRANIMLDQGLMEEVEGLIRSGVSRECKPMQSIGYLQCVEFLDGKLEKAKLEEAITIVTRQYAKRQTTWFKKVKADLRLQEYSQPSSIIDRIKENFSK